MKIFYILSEMFNWVQIFVKTHQTLYLEWRYFTVYKLYLNKVLTKYLNPLPF